MQPLLNLDDVTTLTSYPSCARCNERDWVKFSYCLRPTADCYDAFRYFPFMRRQHFHMLCLRCRHQWYACEDGVTDVYDPTLPTCDKCGNFPTLARVIEDYQCGHRFCVEHGYEACPIDVVEAPVIDVALEEILDGLS